MNRNHSVVRVIKYIDGVHCVGNVVGVHKEKITTCGVCCYTCTLLAHPHTPSSVTVMEEVSYTSTHTWPVTGSLYLYLHLYCPGVYHEYCDLDIS